MTNQIMSAAELAEWKALDATATPDWREQQCSSPDSVLLERDSGRRSPYSTQIRPAVDGRYMVRARADIPRFIATVEELVRRMKGLVQPGCQCLPCVEARVLLDRIAGDGKVQP